MYPRVFLETFWRMELRPQVFVAMSFADRYKNRFEAVIAPAIRSIPGEQLEPYRVDASKSGDSILTEIMDGIAHCQMVLADVSSIGNDPATGRSYRNGNVMYEVGLALACRQPAEVLLVRDDHEKFLFDVSTIPHMTIDFNDEGKARKILRDELVARLNERSLIHDARVRLAAASLTVQEARIMMRLVDFTPDQVWLDRIRGDVQGMVTIPRLLDKQLVIALYRTEEENPELGFVPTPLGRAVGQWVKSNLPQVKVMPSTQDQTDGNEPALAEAS